LSSSAPAPPSPSIAATHWPKIENQKSVAFFQIYSTGFEDEADIARGPAIFDFYSEKYWPLRGDYQGKFFDGPNEKLNTELVDLICPAINRAVNQNVSLQDAINDIPKLRGFDLSRELIPEFVEFKYAAMRIRAMAAHAILYVRGYADGEEGTWEKAIDLPIPTELKVHRIAGPDPMTAETNLSFQSQESIFPVGRQAGNSTMYRNKDLPNLRAASTAKILTTLMTACPDSGRTGPIPVEILDGWIYPKHDSADRKVRLFLVIFLNDK